VRSPWEILERDLQAIWRSKEHCIAWTPDSMRRAWCASRAFRMRGSRLFVDKDLHSMCGAWQSVRRLSVPTQRKSRSLLSGAAPIHIASRMRRGEKLPGRARGVPCSETRLARPSGLGKATYRASDGPACRLRDRCCFSSIKNRCWAPSSRFDK